MKSQGRPHPGSPGPLPLGVPRAHFDPRWARSAGLCAQPPLGHPAPASVPIPAAFQPASSRRAIRSSDSSNRSRDTTRASANGGGMKG